MFYKIFKGSRSSLSSNEMFASPGEDVLFNTTSILIENGVSIGRIPIFINDDGSAELDEFFMVNLTNVELFNDTTQKSINETFMPPRLGRYLTSQVKIQANDGPQGILVFSPSRFDIFSYYSSKEETVTAKQVGSW